MKVYGESNATANITIGNPSAVLVGGRVLLVFCRNNRRVLTLLSSDATGTIWPKMPTDITEQILHDQMKGGMGLGWVAIGPPGGIVHLGTVEHANDDNSGVLVGESIGGSSDGLGDAPLGCVLQEVRAMGG